MKETTLPLILGILGFFLFLYSYFAYEQHGTWGGFSQQIVVTQILGALLMFVAFIMFLFKKRR